LKKHNRKAWRAAGALMLVGFAVAVNAPQTLAAGVAAPGGGQLLRQIQPRKAPAPSSGKTGLKHPKQAHGPIAPGVSFRVKRIRITGNTVVAASVLQSLVAKGLPATMNLKQLHALADRITAYYRQHGYSLTRAVIPAQEIKNGVVEMRVVEAKHGKVNLKNHSRVRTGLLQSTLSPLKPGALIQDRRLDRSLLLLNDIPGIAASATIRPGISVGAADLDVDVRDLPMLTGSLSANNYGNRFTGRARGGISLQLNNPLHLGDQLSFDGITTGKDIRFGRVGYQAVVNGYGTRIGGDFSLLGYRLGGDLNNLNAHGTARVADGWLSQPVYRSRNVNAYVRAGYVHKRLHDRVDASLIRTDRHLQMGYASLYGDERDGFISGGVTGWSVQWAGGRVRFDDPSAELADAATARTAGNFGLWNGRLSRLQQFGGHDALWIAASGQWSVNNLDSVEKLVVGGPDGVRAYDVGVLSADSGYLAQVEWRHQFTPNIQVFGLFDNQRVRVNNRPWAAGVNFASLSGAGGGVRFDWRRWHAEVAAATPVGRRPALITSSTKPRIWARLDVGF